MENFKRNMNEFRKICARFEDKFSIKKNKIVSKFCWSRQIMQLKEVKPIFLPLLPEGHIPPLNRENFLT